MRAAGTPFESQARLWLAAFVVSALINLVVLLAVGLWAVANLDWRPREPRTEPVETVAMIVPMVEAAPEAEAMPVAPPPARPSFARTSADQAEAVPEKADFIGERNTRATSEAALSEGPEMPNQNGREPRWEDEVETTESNYQDGDLASDQVAAPDSPPVPAETRPAEPPETSDATMAAKRDGTKTGGSDAPETSPVKDLLAEGPVPVDRMVKDESREESPKPTPPQREVEGEDKVAEKDKPADQPKPATPAKAPGFRGFQQKTRLVGSLSRVGRSALNVEDSVLGRYHAAVSRAVEREWQRNCVRNRDFIVPGQLTLSFVLDSSGKVRSKAIVEDFGVGNIQKGFTLNSIRDAEIPSMPADLKKQLDGEPLELIYRFNF